MVIKIKHHFIEIPKMCLYVNRELKWVILLSEFFISNGKQENNDPVYKFITSIV